MDAGAVEYLCRKCRKRVCSTSDVVGHEAGGGQVSTEKRLRERKDRGNAGGERRCTSLFLERMEWMGECEEPQGGKLICKTPNCGERLGAYSWVGLTCSCGAWVAPAFQIQVSKVDEWSPEGMGEGTRGFVTPVTRVEPRKR